jgi:hypothetical protein
MIDGLKVEREIFVQNLRQRGLRDAVSVLVWNLRFELGYAIGGFSRASRRGR